MRSYYDSLADDERPERRVGWKRRIGQAYRFELVAQLVGEGDSVVDIGCGTAALATVLRARMDCTYIGVDPIEHELEADVSVLREDVFEWSIPTCDVAVAIGALVDGTERDEAEQRNRAHQLFDKMAAAAPRGVLVAIDLSAFDAAPWRRDPALAGVRAVWFDSDRIVRIAEDELALVSGAVLDPVGARLAVEHSPLGPFDPAEHAWLAHRCGDHDAAREFLSRNEPMDEALARLIRERLG